MKLTRLSLLAAALAGAGGAFAAPIPAELAGSYQALLYSGEGDTSSPNALVALTLTSKGALSGKLTGQDNKTYAFKTKTALDYTAAEAPEGNDPLGTASSEVIEIKRPKMASLFLSLQFKDFEDSDVVEVSLKEGEADLASSDEGFKQITFAKGALPYDAAGTYNTAFELAATPAQGIPAGSGYALGKIDAKGVFKLSGKTGDGTAFTASMAAGPDHRFLMFVNPYKRVNSFLAGKLTLTERSSGGYHMLPAETDYNLKWKKSSLLPKTTDKSYREGFGPLDILVAMEPWVIPGKGETLGGILGIDLDESFDIAFSGGLPSSRTPTALALDIKNNLQVVTGGAGSPSTLIGTGWSKIFSGKIDPKTGKVTITINLEDSVPTSNPLRPKLVKRKVTVEGVVLKVEVEGDGEFRFAPGFVLIPPLDPKTGTIDSYALEFQGPAVLNELYAAAGELAGTYSAVLKRESVTPSGSPVTPFSDGGTISFTISSDLKTITIGGRKLPLAGDSRPVSIVYTDAQTKNLNYYTVQIFINFQGRPSGMFITHNQNIFALPPVIKNVVFSSNNIVKQ